MAVLSNDNGREPLDEGTPLKRTRTRGPYAWGKLESELLAKERAEELGLELRIVRPGAIVDYGRFDPPGALGRRLGSLYVVVGSRDEAIGVVDLRFAAGLISWIARNFEDAPEVLHLLDLELPKKRDLISRLRAVNPDLRIVRVPRFVLVPLSQLAVVAQKLLRPRRPAVNPAKVFAPRYYDNSRLRALMSSVELPSEDDRVVEEV
jgi:nucleoside-diphosphate-sugar epimerase